MININEIITGVEVLITVGTIIYSHLKLNSNIRDHISLECKQIYSDLPKITQITNVIEDEVNKITPTLEALLPDEVDKITLIKRIIDIGATGILDIISVNYQEKAKILKKLVENAIKEYDFNLTDKEKNLIENYIIKILNNKIVPVG